MKKKKIEMVRLEAESLSTTADPVKAVIYCRVSSAGQVQKGHGIVSQETRCRDFAKLKGYEVEQVFSDEAVSGGVVKRPGMQMMLKPSATRRAITPSCCTS